jgi:hypothetical protein
MTEAGAPNGALPFFLWGVINDESANDGHEG